MDVYACFRAGSYATVILRASVTYAESSVMWFSGIFQQFPHKALVISVLGLHADALSPTCTETNK